MNKYEVRVTQTQVDYYHVDAKNEHEAKAFVKAQINNPKDWIYATKVESIKRNPKVDYALKLSKELEEVLI